MVQKQDGFVLSLQRELRSLFMEYESKVSICEMIGCLETTKSAIMLQAWELASKDLKEVNKE